MPTLILRFVFLLGAVWYLAACSSNPPETLSEEALTLPSDAREIGIERGFRLLVPSSFYAQSDDENLDFVRYANVSEDQYVELHAVDRASGEGNKNFDLVAFKEARLVSFLAGSKILREMKSSERLIGKLPAIVVAYDLKRLGSVENWSYWITFIEGEHHYYELRIWTKTSRKGFFEQTANAIIQQFKEGK